MLHSKCYVPLSSRVFPITVPPLRALREPTVTAQRGTTLGTRINKYRPLVMSLRFVRRLRNNTAQSLVLFVKLGVRYLAALRLALEIDTYRV